jgi:hypothetical protein
MHCESGDERPVREAKKSPSVAASKIHEGGMSHAAMPAPASTPNAKTATPVITRAGVRDVKDLCVARRCSAMGTRQRSPTPAQREARFVPAVIGGRFGRASRPTPPPPSLDRSRRRIVLPAPGRARRWARSSDPQTGRNLGRTKPGRNAFSS